MSRSLVQDLEYRVRRSDRARRVRVVVHPHGDVEVVLPRRAAEREAAAAVRELRPWIERQIARAHAARVAVAPSEGTVAYLGGELLLVEQEGRTRAHRRGDELLVPAGAGARAAIERWYRRAARAEAEPRLAEAAQAFGVTVTKLTIRDQQTRWGSASRSGQINLNWRLLLAPEDVFDYVIWHEVCHLVHMDHSPRFWGLLEEHMPGYREPQRWLRRHGAGLVL